MIHDLPTAAALRQSPGHQLVCWKSILRSSGHQFTGLSTLSLSLSRSDTLSYRRAPTIPMAYYVCVCSFPTWHWRLANGGSRQRQPSLCASSSLWCPLPLDYGSSCNCNTGVSNEQGRRHRYVALPRFPLRLRPPSRDFHATSPRF